MLAQAVHAVDNAAHGLRVGAARVGHGFAPRVADALPHLLGDREELVVRDAGEECLVFGLHAEAPARGDRGELDRTPRPFGLELVEHLADVVGVDLAREEALQVAQGQRLGGGEERGLEDEFDVGEVGVRPRCKREALGFIVLVHEIGL